MKWRKIKTTQLLLTHSSLWCSGERWERWLVWGGCRVLSSRLLQHARLLSSVGVALVCSGERGSEAFSIPPTTKGRGIAHEGRFSQATQRSGTHHFHLHSIGQNSMLWSHLNARETENYWLCLKKKGRGGNWLEKCLPDTACSCLFATPWSAARQAPLSMGLSRQEYWSGLPCPPGSSWPRDQTLCLTESPALQEDSLPLRDQGSPVTLMTANNFLSLLSTCCCELYSLFYPFISDTSPNTSCLSSGRCPLNYCFFDPDSFILLSSLPKEHQKGTFPLGMPRAFLPCSHEC